jgi:HK97 family phage portal protein
MKIFGWKSAGRGSLRPAKTHVQLARAYGGPVLGTWPTSYEAQVREGYLNNAIAQRAVRLVAEGVASVAIKSSDASDGRIAAAALKLVKETSAGQQLMETVAAHLLLHGNAYIEIMRGDDGSPVELYALRPERVCVEADTRGWPIAFLYKAGQATTRMAVENIIHIRTMHPLDDHYGLGCLGAASGAVAIHNAAAKWNKALLDNAARPSGALTYDTGDTGALSTEQFDRLRAELDASFAGAANAGRPMLLEGGLKWQALSLSPADMDFVGLKESAAREIALAFGVPPMLLGLPGDATYANYREANKALWRQAILPLAGKIFGALAQGLSNAFSGLSLDIDLEQISALAEDRERLWAQLSAADFLTMDERREAAGFEALPVKAPPPAVPVDNETGVVELKYNPWHDNEDGKFTFSNHGNYAGGGGGFGGGASRTANRLTAPTKLKKPDGVRPAKIHKESHGAIKPRTRLTGERMIKPKIKEPKNEKPEAEKAKKPKVAKPRAVKPKAEKGAKYFSASTKPTIENAIAQIKNSKFGKTKAGKYVTDKVERLHKAGKIVIADTTDASGSRLRGKWDDKVGVLTVDMTMAGHVNDIASELVHEATHSLLSDEYKRTNRKPGGNSIEQEALTNGYQLQLYREQRKYRKNKDLELERRLEESNKGKLSQDIRKRYATAPQKQPKNK